MLAVRGVTSTVVGMQGAGWERRSVIDAPSEVVCRGESDRTLLESVNPGITAPAEFLEASPYLRILTYMLLDELQE